MKTAVFFLAVLMGHFLSGVTQNVAKSPETPLPMEVSKPNASAVDIPSHVNEYMNANPQVVSDTAPPASSAAGATAIKCECAVFNTEAPTELDKPILTQAPMSISCDLAGEKNCRKLCSALAEAAKGHGPQLLCATLGHYNNLKASVHSRVCGAKAWKFTGLTSPTEICCHEHQVIDCKDKVENPPANQL